MNKSKNNFNSFLFYKISNCIRTLERSETVKKNEPSKAKFYYLLDIENYVPKNHILRLIDKYIDFSFIKEKTKDLYYEKGRPAFNPEMLIRILLIGYLFDITGERKLCEDINMNLAYRWFSGLDIDDKVPDHSTFSKNRHGRFKDSGII